MEYLPHLAALGGAILGTGFSWFLCLNKAQAMRARFEERAKTANKSIVDLEAGCANLEAEVRQLRHSEAVSLKRQSELELLAQTQQRGLAEKQQLLKEAEHRMAQNFKAISIEALRSTQEEFLQLARSSFDSQQQVATSEQEQRRVAVETLVRPVAATLSKVENRIGDLEQARRESEATLSAQVRQMAQAHVGLQKETAQLVKALRQPAGRGRWGEVQLQRVVELSGMQEHCDFYAPNKHGNETGPQRPNLVINLPSDRIIAIDASTSLEAYLSAVESADEETHAKEMKRHAGLVANHLADLASPSYRAQFLKKPEFIVLFLPSESFLSAALSEDPNLLERGIEQGVILATPATLVALLRSAAVGWRQDGIAEQARTISDAGRELYAHVSSLAEQVSRVGQSLDATVQDYNVAIGALQSNVLPGARKLSDLGVPAHPAQLPVVPEVTTAVRQPHADLSRLPAAETAFVGFAETGPPTTNPDPNGAAEDLRAAAKSEAIPTGNQPGARD